MCIGLRPMNAFRSLYSLVLSSLCLRTMAGVQSISLPIGAAPAKKLKMEEITTSQVKKEIWVDG